MGCTWIVVNHGRVGSATATGRSLVRIQVRPLPCPALRSPSARPPLARLGHRLEHRVLEATENWEGRASFIAQELSLFTHWFTSRQRPDRPEQRNHHDNNDISQYGQQYASFEVI